jgi:hypothetical protein
LLLLSTDSNPDQLASVVVRQLGQVELVVVDKLDPSVLYVGWRRCHRVTAIRLPTILLSRSDPPPGVRQFYGAVP